MTVLALYKGRKGINGTNGINGLGSANTDDFTVDSPIMDVLQPNKLSKNSFLQIERNGFGTLINRYGEDVFAGIPSTTNYVAYSEDFTQWDDLFATWSISGAATDPFGGNAATEITLSQDTDSLTGLGYVVSDGVLGWSSGSYMVVSFYIKKISGEISSLDIGFSSTIYYLNGISDEWERKVIKIAATSTGTTFAINPRGKSGAKFAIYGAQVQDSATTDYIKTTGAIKTVQLDNSIIRQNNDGYLIEESKTNLIHFSNDFKKWTVTDGTIIDSDIPDPFGFKNQANRVSFSSLPDVMIETTTDPLIEDDVYTVSFFAFVAGGSLTSLAVSLGDGLPVLSPQPSVVKYQRIELQCEAGQLNNIKIIATSTALTAQLHIACLQIEEGFLSSYFEASDAGQTRVAETAFMEYEYNYPAPSLPWSFIFKNGDIKNDSRIKTIFSNGLTGSDEFSLTYTNKLLTLTSGLNTSSFDTFDFDKVALTYDGTDLKTYNEQTLVNTDTVGSTTTIGTNAYLGYNGTDEYINGYLGKCMFYNVALTDNDIIYLMGA